VGIFPLRQVHNETAVERDDVRAVELLVARLARFVDLDLVYELHGFSGLERHRRAFIGLAGGILHSDRVRARGSRLGHASPQEQAEKKDV
jgi:hypothetical protein